METQDKMLSLDMGLSDCLYRIRRDDGRKSRIVYIVVTDISILPEDHRTYGPSVVAELRKLEHWYDLWDTLTVRKDQHGVHCILDAFTPHALREDQLYGTYSRFNVLKLPILKSVNDRVFRVMLDSQSCFLKIARFPHELGWLAQEITAYSVLEKYTSSVAPKLLGYTYEDQGQRMTGFLYEELDGEHAGIDDLVACQDALRELHALGIVHGDINKYNILMTSDGPKFIDFEDSILASQKKADALDLDELKAEEMANLRVKLLDTSGKGQPWIMK